MDGCDFAGGYDWLDLRSTLDRWDMKRLGCWARWMLALPEGR